MNWTERALKSFLERLVTRGTLVVHAASGRSWSVGDGQSPQVDVAFTDGKAIDELIRDPEVKLGELFMDGRLTVDQGDFYGLLELVLQHRLDSRQTTTRRVLSALRTLRHRLVGHNGLVRSRRNVAHHYDLNAAFYELFLDVDRQYSCAYFDHPDATLEEAQRAKCRHIAAKLLMRPGVSVLDIGSGWGGMGLYLAEIGEAGAVKGITLSSEQLIVARKRAEAKALGQVHFELEDYRKLRGSFDRIVSVGMFEHVGPKHYDAFFSKASDLLAEDGVMLLHTIGHTSSPTITNPWITRYIFPGGHLPSLSEVLPAIERAGLMVADVEVLRHHYAETLSAWRARFLANRDKALALYDERFCLMWEAYLAMSEAAFRFLDVVVYQFQLTRRNDVVPITRDYIARSEMELKRRELTQGDVLATYGKVATSPWYDH
ncbi:SAM-dependent methyltransferase [Oryzibacter oryziterrae]|uniref:SAM-dependent methyltransferase n=1 Tax=Oryzibacter oryziterrae TaxID=2766474 RepID=UPI001F1FD035|nr:cyclopropane-fatty-acyl-phospholipid synthase family protein [Oryzibacter oryziterrae]